ncbi:MAG TPA: glycosyltransferase family 4 protein [Gaiellales bacterium]
MSVVAVRRRLRICLMSWRDLAHPQAGGSEVVVDRLARGAVAHGHDVTLMTGGPVAAPRPYRIIRTGGDYTQYLATPLAYRRNADRWDVVVDVENGIPYFAPLWQRKPVVCLVHHVHGEQWGWRFPWPVSAAGDLIERHGMPAAYRDCLFLAVSRSTARALAEIGVDPGRLRVMDLGVDRPEVPPAAETSDEPLFVALGRLVPYKRIHLLLDVWRRVQRATGGRLVIVGDGPERERLEALGTPGVTFAGRVPDEQKWEILSRAWCMLQPAIHEGWGVSVIEAASMGTPAIAFDVPGLRDAIVQGQTGMLVGSHQEFVDAWVRIASDHAERRRMSDAALRASRAFTWERSVDTFLGVVEEALGRSGQALPRDVRRTSRTRRSSREAAPIAASGASVTVAR